MRQQVADGDPGRVGRGIAEVLQLGNVALGGIIERQLPRVAELENRHRREALRHRCDAKHRVGVDRRLRRDVADAHRSLVRQFPVDDDAPRRARGVDRRREFGEKPVDVRERRRELGPAPRVAERRGRRDGLLRDRGRARHRDDEESDPLAHACILSQVARCYWRSQDVSTGRGFCRSDIPTGRGLRGSDIPTGRGLRGSGIPTGRGLRGSGISTGRGLRGSGISTGRGLRGSGIPTGRGLRGSGIPTGRGLRGSGIPAGRGLRGSGISTGRGLRGSGASTEGNRHPCEPGWPDGDLRGQPHSGLTGAGEQPRETRLRRGRSARDAIRVP